ncbi:hypothetical protein B2J86_01645 [Acidovorax sp. SRB_14]|nr:hypothetical protein [Acidovorax sp. SRB_14]
MKSMDVRSRSFAVAVGLVWLLIVYGSLYPFQWDFAAPQAFIWSGRIGLVDLIENILLFLPLGGLLGWAAQGRLRRWWFFAGWFGVALVVASTLQWLQKYLPRTPALSDVLFNMVGYVLGWGAGCVARWRVGHLLVRHQGWAGADRFALVLIALWWLAELYPLIPTFDVSSVAQNVKSLWQLDLWQPRRMLLHAGMAVIGASAVAHLARTAQLAHRARAVAGVAAAAVLAGKFVVVDQSPGMAVVLGIAGGWLLWRWMDPWPPGPRWAATAWVALATYLLDAIWPWAWRTPPADMAWMPFASSLSTWVQSAISARAFECLCFGGILWSTVRNGALLGGMTVCTAVLAFACEWTQRYLPTRTAEITSVVLAIGMGWLLSACTAARPIHAQRLRERSA